VAERIRIGDLHRTREFVFHERDWVRTPSGREATVVGFANERVQLVYDGDGDEVQLPAGLLRLVKRAEV
jgi:hypothetical protein